MNNPFDDMRNAVAHAKAVTKAADDQANALADLLEDRLQKVSPYRLKKLKAHLQGFNANTGRWKHRWP